MTQVIANFGGLYKVLSNFYRDPISGFSVEALFQSEKCKPGDPMKEKIAAMTPRDAKKAGRRIELREDWEQIKVQFMAYWVNDKFSRNGLWVGIDYPKVLARTGNALLKEGNNWHDNFWGNCYCGRPRCAPEGANVLGVILMTIREAH